MRSKPENIYNLLAQWGKQDTVFTCPSAIIYKFYGASTNVEPWIYSKHRSSQHALFLSNEALAEMLTTVKLWRCEHLGTRVKAFTLRGVHVSEVFS